MYAFFQLLAPFASMTLLSAILAFGLDRALQSSPPADSPIGVDLDVSATRPSTSHAVRTPAEPGNTWVILSSVDGKQTLWCTTPVDKFGSDALELSQRDLDSLAAALTCYRRT